MQKKMHAVYLQQIQQLIPIRNRGLAYF